jgi:hypothetical protein
MSDFVVLPVNRFTAPLRVLRQCGRTSDGWSALAWMEKIMSKSNDSSKLGRTTPTPDLGGAATFTVRELRDDELQEVSGGADPYRGFSFRIDVSGINRGGF